MPMTKNNNAGIPKNWEERRLEEIRREKSKREDKEKFDDYVPPYKNLGAIFIMAYNKAVENK